MAEANSTASPTQRWIWKIVRWPLQVSTFVALRDILSGNFHGQTSMWWRSLFQTSCNQRWSDFEDSFQAFRPILVTGYLPRPGAKQWLIINLVRKMVVKGLQNTSKMCSKVPWLESVLFLTRTFKRLSELPNAAKIRFPGMKYTLFYLLLHKLSRKDTTRGLESI